MKWDETAPAAENARRVLPAMARDWFERGAGAARDGASVKKLHAFRLSTKHFRYTLELFRTLYGPGMERRLAELRDLQRRLGDVNDCAITRLLVAAVLPKASPERILIEEYLAGCERRRSSAFRRSWKATFGAAGETARWARYLARPRGGKL